MTHEPIEARPEPAVREADEAAAPFVFAYLVVVVAWLAAVLAWVFWYRGYA